MTSAHKSKLLSVVLAVLAAFALWIYIVTIVNPEDTQVIQNVPVQFSGQDALYQDNGLVITTGADATVTISVSGKRSDVKKLNRDNVIAVVDVSRIRNARDYSLSYEVQFANDLSDITVERTPNVVSFTVENLVSKQVEVKAVLVGNVAEGYIAQDWQYDFDTVLVRGPESVVDEISYAQVVLNRTDLNKTVTESIPFTLVDSGGNAVDTTNLTCDLQEIEVTLPVLKYREIPLDVTFIEGGGATAENVTREIDPPTITVAGDATALEGINKITLGNIDLSTIEESDTFTFPIVLENGLINVSGDETATVEVKIHGLITRMAYISDIRFVNEPEGFTATPKRKSFTVTLRGTEEALNSLSSSDLYAEIDLSAYTSAGTYSVNATIRSEKDVEFGVVGTYTVICSIAEESEDEEA